MSCLPLQVLSTLNQNLAATGKHTDVYCKVHSKKKRLKWNVDILSTVQEDDVEVDEFPVDPDVSYKFVLPT